MNVDDAHSPIGPAVLERVTDEPESDDRATSDVDLNGSESAAGEAFEGDGAEFAPRQPDEPPIWWPFERYPGDEAVRRWGRRLFSLATVGACVVYVFWIVHPELIFRNTTPTGGDMGAHVWGPAFMRDHLLPNFRLTGWTSDWYNGFPAYTFYMVLPSLAIITLGAIGVVPWFLAPILIAAVGWAWWTLRERWSESRWQHRVLRAATSVAAVLLPILLIDVPYNVAFKLIAVSGIVTLPIACWWLGRGLGLPLGGPEMLAVASVAFLMDKDLFHIYGGNIASTMAGEFAFSISLSFLIFFLGTMALGIRTGRYRAAGVIFGAGALLSHAIPGLMYLVPAALILLLLRPTKRALVWVATVGPVAGLIASVWYLAFEGQSTFLNDMGWEKLGPIKNAQGVNVDHLSEYMHYLWPILPDQSTLLDKYPNMWFGRVFFVLAGIGVLLSLVLVVRAGLYLGLVTAVSGLAFWLMPQNRFWNARILPLYYLGIYLVAAIGVWLLVRCVLLAIKGAWSHPPPVVAIGVLGTSMLVLFVGFGMQLRDLPGGEVVTPANQPAQYHWLGLHSVAENPTRYWADWNFRGLEGKPNDAGSTQGNAASKEYFAVVAEMKRIGRDDGCGRTMWEYDGDRMNTYGTPMAFMMFPYFTKGCIGSQEGLYFEASSTTPFHFIMQDELSAKCSCAQRFDIFGRKDAVYRGFNLDLGIQHMQMLGIRYYIADSDTAKNAANADARLTKVGASGPYNVYRVADAPLVRGLDRLPTVWTDVTDAIHDWAGPASTWFQTPAKFDELPATSGPSNWPRSTSKTTAKNVAVRKAVVTDIKTSENSLSFTVDQPGTPVLVTTSYFPNWKVEGADGPYRVAPNLMVVIPNQRHVSFTYGRSGEEIMGMFLALVGLGLLVLFIAQGDWVVGREPHEFLGDRAFSDEPDPEPEAEPVETEPVE